MAARKCLTPREAKHSAAGAFYRSIDRTIYACESDPLQHPFYPVLKEFVDHWRLGDKKVLEIGSGQGIFQDLVLDYVGVDVAENLAPLYRKKYHVVKSAMLPFEDGRFDAVFSYATHEHIADIESSFEEIIRVLRVGGVCLLAPAWHTRKWFAKGLLVRPYRDLGMREKMEKLTIPIRNSPILRWPITFARRIARLVIHLAEGKQPSSLRYKKLEANYETFWHSDSDACNSLDPFDVLIWFRSRDFLCINHPNLLKSVMLRTVALELKKSSDIVGRDSGN